ERNRRLVLQMANQSSVLAEINQTMQPQSATPLYTQMPPASQPHTRVAPKPSIKQRLGQTPRSIKNRLGPIKKPIAERLGTVKNGGNILNRSKCHYSISCAVYNVLF